MRTRDPHFETWVCFSVYGDELELESVSRKFGREPTHSWRKGSLTGGRPRETGIWCLEVPLAPEIPADAQVKWIFSNLPHVRLSEIADIGATTMQIEVVVKMRGMTAGVGLSADTLKLMSEAGIDLDVNLYSIDTPEETVG